MQEVFIFQHFSFYEQLKFQAQLSMKKVLKPQGQEFQIWQSKGYIVIALHFMLVSPTPTISTIVLEYMIYVSVPVQREMFHKQVGIHRVTQVYMGVL